MIAAKFCFQLILNVILLFYFSLYRNERADVRAIEPGAPLSQPERSLLQLHVCGWELGTHMAQRREPGFKFLAVHPRSDGLRTHIARGCAPHRTSAPSDHPGQNTLQAQYPRYRFRPPRHPLQDEQSGNAYAQG